MEFAVVVVAHCRAVRARVVNVEHIADVYRRNGAVNSEFIAVFAQAARDIADEIAGGIFFAEHGDVVVCAVNRRAHEVCRASVQTNIFFVDVFFMNRRGDECAVRTCGETP